MFSIRTFIFSLLGIFFLNPHLLSAEEKINNLYQSAFENAYRQYPDVPKGVLETVAFNNSRFRFVQPDLEEASCMGLPSYQGFFGLVENGQNYFRENLKTIAQKSQFSLSNIKRSPETQALAYAEAWQNLNQQLPNDWDQTERIIHLFEYLSEIPRDTSTVNNFALNSQLYVYFLFLNDAQNQQHYNFPAYQFDLEDIFGKKNLKVLSASGIQLGQNQVQNQNGLRFRRRKLSSDYPPAIWSPTSCNFSSRGGIAISSVTIHTVQGSYAGAISWFKNCNAQVSAHYVLRSVDGQVTQVVAEEDKAWHVGTENPYTIGLEHEGYVSDSSWYTAAMYNSSANLVKDITQSGYGINPHSTYRGTQQTVINSCYRIKGHIHYPNQTHTDPGIYWDWDFYHYLINNPIAPMNTFVSCNGSISDSSGTSNYGNLERYLTVINPGNAGVLELSFSDFDLEDGYDYLYIYDGTDIQAPLIASLTGNQIPATITAQSGKMALLFESDCLYNGRGWQANWTCSGCTGTLSIQLDSMQEVSCGNGANTKGLLNVSGSGGVPPYQYSWSNGANDSVINNLDPGQYTVTVQDQQGCFASGTYVLDSDSLLIFDKVLEHSQCYGDSAGEVAYEILNGQAPYTFEWSTGAQNFIQKNLTPGYYSVTISDARNCVQIDTFSIQEPASELEIEEIRSRFGLSFYLLEPTVTGGTSPYSYKWSNGESDKNISVSESDIYWLEVEDAQGCKASAYKRIDFPTSVREVVNNRLEIYPVPFESTLNIAVVNIEEHLRLEIRNMLGQQMWQGQINQNTVQLSTQTWSPGVYFISLFNDKGKMLHNQKVLKY